MATRRGAEDEGVEVVMRGDGNEEEDYIDMDLSPAATGPREFEFMSAPLDRWGEPVAASPADELFYKGKLLPLHLPPRIQMVEELLDGRGCGGTTSRSLLLGGGGYSTAPATPYESCTASPANSCYVSGELNVEEYFQEYAAAGLGLAAAAAAAGERKTWSKRLKFVRQLNLGLNKLKASKAYLLKTIFPAAKPAGNVGDDRNVMNHGETRGGHGGHNHGHLVKAWRKNPFGQIRSNRYTGGGGRAAPEEGEGWRRKEREHGGGHRRSFSSVMVRYSSSSSSTTKTSPPTPITTPPSFTSSSCSTSTSSSASSSVRTSSDSDGGAALRRSSSANEEPENPIQGLIAYCKRSQQLASVRKSASDAGFRFLSSAASKIAAESDADGLDELIENLQRMKM